MGLGGSPKRRKGDDAFGGPDFFENVEDLDGSDGNFDSDQSGNRGSSRAKRRRKKDKKGLTHAVISKGKDGADVEGKPGSKSRKTGDPNDNKDLDSHLEQLQNGQSRGGKGAFSN